MTFGILDFGAYIPCRRIRRQTIADANSWLNTLGAKEKGERSLCNWDEDPITMAVEAARDALSERGRSSIGSVSFASTSFPFVDRLNSGLVADALGLPDTISATDVTGSQRAATSALAKALGAQQESLLVAAERRPTRAGSVSESQNGDGAAALMLGEGNALATLVAAASLTVDFVDHYRTPEAPTDYHWEERWVRDAGHLDLLPRVIVSVLEKAGLSAAEVTHLCVPGVPARVIASMAASLGIAPAAIRDNLARTCGDTGVAHPLIMLAAALEEAKPGDRVLLLGFGQGADALLFQVTQDVLKPSRRLGVKGHLANRREEANYLRFLAFRGGVELERGMRAEADKLTQLSVLWRNRDALTRFVGGRCTDCGTCQFPRTRICVNPDCNAVDRQVPEPFAEKTGRINSFTVDHLTYSPAPPACYGMIQFEGGGRWIMDFTDIGEDEMQVNQEMKMVFRIKDIDHQRGFRRYFWKATPAATGRS